MAERPLKYRVLISKLKRFDVVESTRRGKGSERMLTRLVAGHVEHYFIKCHRENEVKPRAVIRAARRRLGLTSEDGIPDSEFYA